MSLDFNALKTAIGDINKKFPGKIDPVDKDKNALAQAFLKVVFELTDDEAAKLQPDTILLYNSMMENPDNAKEPEPAPEVTATAKEAEKARKAPPSRVSEPKRRDRDVFAKFQGKVSPTARVTMICCDHPEMSCQEVKNMLLAEGMKAASSTVDVEYANAHKVLAYLALKGKIANYRKPPVRPEGDK